MNLLSIFNGLKFVIQSVLLAYYSLSSYRLSSKIKVLAKRLQAYQTAMRANLSQVDPNDINGS